MPEISNLQVVVGYDDSAVSSGTGHTSQLLGGVGSAATMMGTALVAAGAAGAAGLVVAVKAAGDLQQSVANISTIKPEIDTSAVFGALNEMSTRIPATAAELGDSLYNVFSSMDVGQADALALVETFAKGAAGAGTSAETFGTAAMGVMNAYGLSAKDASAISDMFFDTINKGVVTGDELAASLGPVTQSAKAAGVEWRDLGPMIAAVTKEGGPAAQNMNNLNNLFQKFTTSSAQLAMNKMGIATTDAAGKFRAVPDVLTDLKAHLATLTQAEAAAALQQIFPDAQARIGAQTLMSQIDFVNEALKTNQEASGSTAAAYEKMSATFNSQSKLLINNLMAVGTAIGAEVLPMITPLISAFSQSLPAAFQAAKDAVATVKQVLAGDWAPSDSINPFVNAVGKAAVMLRDTFGPVITAISDVITSRLVPAFQKAWQWISDNRDVVAALAVGLAAFAILTTVAGWVTGIVGAFAAMSAAITAAGGVVGAIIAVLGGPLTVALIGVSIAVGALLIAWNRNIGGIQQKALELLAIVGPAFQQLVAIIQQALSGDVAAAFNQFIALVVSVGQQLLPLLAAWGQEFIDWIAPMIPPFLAAVTAFAQQFFAWIVQQVPAIIAVLAQWALAFVEWVAPFIPPLLAALATAAAALLKWLADQIPPIIAQLVLWAREFVAWVAPLIPPMLAALATVGAALLDWLKAQIPLIAAQLVLWGQEFTTWVNPASISMMEALGVVAGSIVRWLVETQLKILAGVTAWATEFGKIGALGAPEVAKGLATVFVEIETFMLTLPVKMLQWGIDAIAAFIEGFLSQAIPMPAMPSFGGGKKNGEGQTLSYNPSNTPAGEIDNSSRASFSRSAYPLALQAAGGDSELAQRMIAMAMSENGTVGTGKPLGVGFNFGGIKGTGTAGSGNYGTWESVNGARVNQNDNFAHYNNPQEGFNAVPAFIAQNFPSQYAEYKRTGDSAALIRAINAGGYATNPSWFQDIENIRQRDVAPNIPSGPPMNPALMTRIPLGGKSLPGSEFPPYLPQAGSYGPGSDPREWPGFMNQVHDQLPEWATDLATIQSGGETHFTAVADIATQQGAVLVSASRDALGNTVSIYRDTGGQLVGIVTDSTGRVTSEYATTAVALPAQAAVATAGVTGQYNLMAAGAITSATNMGTGILTNVIAASGATIATTTSTTGQVLAQYATLANGVTLNMSDMAAGVVTSQTDLGTGILTVVQDMAGNYVATVTDMSGNITTQYAGLATATTTATVDGNAAIIANVQATSQEMISQTTDQFGNVMRIYQDANGQITQTISDASGKNLSIWKQSADTMTKTTVDGQAQMLSTVKNSMGGTTAIYKNSAGEIVTIITDASGKIVSEFKRAADGTKPVEESINRLGDTVKNLKPPDLSGFVKEFKKVEKAANSASDAIATVDGKGGKKSGGGKDNVFGKAAGGPVPFGQPVLVGEEGPEMFTPFSNGTITPNSRLSMGDGAGPIEYHVVDFKIDDNLAERIFLTGRDISIKRGTVSV